MARYGFGGTDGNWKLFWTKLAKLDDWFLYRGRCIRRKNWLSDECMITAVCNKLQNTDFRPSEVVTAGLRLGLSEELIEQISDAADLVDEPDGCFCISICCHFATDCCH